MFEKVRVVEPVTLIEIRKLAGMTQEEFSKFLGVPNTSYRRYEKDASKMELGLVFTICEKTGIPIEKIKV